MGGTHTRMGVGVNPPPNLPTHLNPPKNKMRVLFFGGFTAIGFQASQAALPAWEWGDNRDAAPRTDPSVVAGPASLPSGSERSALTKKPPAERGTAGSAAGGWSVALGRGRRRKRSCRWR